MLSDPFTTLFKKGSIKAMRAITAMDMNSPEIVERVSTEVWKKIWIHDLDITDEPVLMDAFAKAGLSEEQGREFLGLAGTKEVKRERRRKCLLQTWFLLLQTRGGASTQSLSQTFLLSTLQTTH